MTNHNPPARMPPPTDTRDGGPAFPQGKGIGDRFIVEGGMTLRDAMALSVHAPEELSIKWAEVLIGEKYPKYAESELTRVDWWMRVEAAYRYRLADAMLKARETPPEN